MKKNNSHSGCNGNLISRNFNNLNSSKDDNNMMIDDEIHDGLPKMQLIKLILDSLDSMGYKETVKVLEKESNVQLENKLLQNIKEYIISGKWDTVNKLLSNLNLTNGDVNKIKFLIARQKYLELLDKEDLKGSLSILRNELISLDIETENVHKLSYYLFLEPKERCIQANWDSNTTKSRKILYDEINRILCKNQFLSRGRLHDLIKQALLFQESLCSTCQICDHSINLFQDHRCLTKTLDWSTKQVLYGHNGEVWGCKFSPNGTQLATFDSCGTIIIWTQKPDSKYNIYRKFEESSVHAIDWNSDNNRLLVCTKRHAIVYDLEENSIIMKLKVHNTCTSCGWIPNKDEFLTSGMDGKLHHIQYIPNYGINSSSNENESISNGISDGNNENVPINPILYTWNCDSIINDFSINADGAEVILVDHKNNLICYDLNTKQKLFSTPEKNLLISCSISNNILLINCSSTITPFIGNHPEQFLLVYDIEKRQLISKLYGYKQFRYVIRSCFLGKRNQYVVSGSEDSLVYIWYLPTGKLVNKLSGHTSVVNSVTWNQYDGTFASCSDDGTVRIWSSSLSRM